MTLIARPVLDRFMEKIVVVDSGCWIWVANRNNDGYGIFASKCIVTADGRRSTLAHRVSYLLFVGAVPRGLEIDHLCRERACVNWRHLEPVTHRVNSSRRSGLHVLPGMTCPRCCDDMHTVGAAKLRVCYRCRNVARRRRYAATASSAARAAHRAEIVNA